VQFELPSGGLDLQESMMLVVLVFQIGGTRVPEFKLTKPQRQFVTDIEPVVVTSLQ
jgi:hypothetical protein